MGISVIVPTYNEQDYLEPTLKRIKQQLNKIDELIVVDGGSTDSTGLIAKRFTNNVFVSEKSRSIQMNFGAKHAINRTLYFVHADSIIPENAIERVRTVTKQKQDVLGSFSLKFIPSSIVLRFYESFVRFPFLVCRGGDQSLFISKSLFERLEGFNTNFPIMEDIEFIKRVSKKQKFVIFPEKVLTSSRKYARNGEIRLQLIFGLMHLKFWIKASPAQLISTYKKHIK